MPVETTYLEHAIVYTRWIGNVTMDDLFASQGQGITLITEQGIDEYVVIVDMMQGDIAQIDIRGFWHIANNPDDPMIGTVIFGSSAATQLIGNTIGKVMNMKVVFCKTREEAIAAARKILQARTG